MIAQSVSSVAVEKPNFSNTLRVILGSMAPTARPLYTARPGNGCAAGRRGRRTVCCRGATEGGCGSLLTGVFPPPIPIGRREPYHLSRRFEPKRRDSRGSCGRQATPDGRCGARESERGRAASRMVRPRAPRSALAISTGKEGRSLPGVAQRDHAAADRGQDGHSLLPRVPAALADGRGACGRQHRRCARRLGRARLLQPRAKSAQVRASGGCGARRQISRRRGGAGDVAGHRSLYGGGGGGDRLRGEGHAGRRQCRAGGGAAVRDRRAAAGRQAAS